MAKPRESRLEEFIDNPRRAVWVLALPMMAGMLFHTLYAVVDMAFVGRVGPEALAAITFVGPFFFVAIALTSGLFTGITAAVAQAVGRKDERGADLAASNGMGLALVMGVLFALGGGFMGPAMLEAAGPRARRWPRPGPTSRSSPCASRCSSSHRCCGPCSMARATPRAPWS